MTTPTLLPRECRVCFNEFTPTARHPGADTCSAKCRGQLGGEARDYSKDRAARGKQRVHFGRIGRVARGKR